MAITIVPINKGNLSLVAQAGEKFGMPRSVGWLRRCLFDPTVEDLTDDEIRGHMAVKDDGEVVAIQCYYYMPGYFRQKKILINTGCIMGADAKYGEELICCLDRNKETRKQGQMAVGNCIASPRSAKFSKVYSRMKEGPDAVRRHYLTIVDCTEPIFWVLRKTRVASNWLLYVMWLAARPVSCIVNALRFAGTKSKQFCIREYVSIDRVKFGRFWSAFLAGNTGVITSRDPKRLAWLFDESMRAGFVCVLAAEKEDEIVGYVLLRRYPCKKGPLNDYSIYDICAVNNDVKCLSYLLVEAVRYASKHRGARVSYSGAMPKQDEWLNAVTWHRCTTSEFSPFFYKTRDKEIEASLNRNEGWFFGAFDGEKCLGHGRYIDA